MKTSAKKHLLVPPTPPEEATSPSSYSSYLCSSPDHSSDLDSARWRARTV
ncbi:hypothetical protein BofuT4_uP136930.1 [Botrytis cinerea T4]|uniref:Uncharacterized protein n=1 Tax=Botryotinia fuckeliana (strain T4) TaxID=999810 RepID=G2YPV0_BOTF4|nr:hypothetical protein BofuT4_uP136930.1 [Botrytis cinerea T4]